MAAPRLSISGAPATLQTRRLRLEAPNADAHATAFAEGIAASAPSLAYVNWGLRPRDVAWARRFCDDDARSRVAGEDLAFHVFERADHGWAGRIDVHSIDFAAARGEIGYVADQRRAGRGLMHEAVRAVMAMCFGLGFERLEAMSDARNRRALHFAASLGLQFEGLLRHHERDPHGELCDMALYAMLRGGAAARGLAGGLGRDDRQVISEAG